jgi:hypothetical protein
MIPKLMVSTMHFVTEVTQCGKGRGIYKYRNPQKSVKGNATDYLCRPKFYFHTWQEY